MTNFNFVCEEKEELKDLYIQNIVKSWDNEIQSNVLLLWKPLGTK